MKIAVFTNKPYAQCETFIKLQIDNLPFDIIQYWGGHIPFNFEARQKTNSLLYSVLRRLRFYAPPKILNQICDQISQYEIKVVVAHYGIIGEAVLPICMQLDLPLLVHFHGHDAVRKSVLEANNNYKNLFAYHKLIVVSVSHEMTKRLIAIGCPKEKIRYNTYGPSDKFLAIQPTYKKKQFISIGRFVEKKAPHLVILAFNEVLKTHSDVRLIYAGDGILLDSCKDLVAALGIENSIDFVGRITPIAYQNYLRDALAYVQHSIETQDGDMEGTPVSILEASASGLAVISTLHAGIPDVILNNETGLLSKEKDIESMAENMNWILDHREQACAMGGKGKERIFNHFSIERHLDELTSIIHKAAKL